MGRRNEAFLSFGFLEFLGEFLLLLNDTGQKAAFGKMHEGEFSGRAQNLRKGHTPRVAYSSRPRARGRDSPGLGTKGMNGSPSTAKTEIARGRDLHFEARRGRISSGWGEYFLGKTLALKRTH